LVLLCNIDPKCQITPTILFGVCSYTILANSTPSHLPSALFVVNSVDPYLMIE